MPPAHSTPLKPMLPALMWLQGIHSRLCGTRSGSSGSVRSPSWPAITPAIMPKVCGTPLGMPVDPEVNSTLATEAWLSVSRAAATAGVGVVAVSSASATAPSPVPSAVTKASSGCWARSVWRARSYSAPDCAKTTRGRTTAAQCRSLAWSVEISELAGLIGATGTPAV